MLLQRFILRLINKIKLIFIPVVENHYRPKFLESRCLMFCLVILFILKLATFPFIIYFSKSIFFGAIIKDVLLELLNRERERNGLQPLKVSPILERAAFLKAQDMLEKGYFSHYSPEGISPWHWFKLVGYNYKNAGENLAIGFLDSQETHRAWMNSFSHRANLLSSNYQEVGIAILRGKFQGRETTIVVQLFGSPRKSSVVPRVITKNKSELPAASPNISYLNTGENFISSPLATPSSQVLGEFNPSINPLPSNLSFKEKFASSFNSFFSLPANNLPEKIIFIFNQLKKGAIFKFFSFLALDYSLWIQAICYGFLILIILALIINIFVKINVQYWDLILKALGFIFILILFILLDHGTIINLVPHDLKISIISEIL